MIDMGDKNEMVNINVVIADRQYPLKVLKSVEEQVKTAVKLANERIKEYQSSFPGKDRQDYIAMCLLNFAVERETLQSNSQHFNLQMENRLTELEHILSEFAR